MSSTNQDEYTRTALRLPRELHKALQEAARQQDRSFNGQVVALLRAALAPAAPAAGART